MREDDVAATRLRMAQEVRLLAEQGVAKKQFYLGRFYESGLGGFPKNYAEAEKWYRKAADQGYAPAQCMLADLYYWGREGLPKNAAEAWFWHHRAAEQGSGYSRFQVANMCALGELGAQSYVAAVYWYHFYAQASHTHFCGAKQLQLGICVLPTKGTPTPSTGSELCTPMGSVCRRTMYLHTCGPTYQRRRATKTRQRTETWLQ